MRSWIPGLLLTGLAACGGAEAPPPPPPVPVFGAQSGYARVSDEILDFYLSRHPIRATLTGERAFDTTLGSYFAVDLERATLDARALLTRLGQVNRSTLPREDGLDHRLLENALRAELLDLEELDAWRSDPVRYVDLIGEGIASVLEDRGLTAEAKAAAVDARIRAVPLVLRAARQNLVASRVPRLMAGEALARARVLRDRLRQFQHPAVAALPSSSRASLDAARAAAAASTDSFAVWIETHLLPGATGDLRMGAGPLEQYLALVYHQDLPLDVMDRINRQAIAEHREWMEREAMQLDPLQHADELIGSLLAENPARLTLIDHDPTPRSRVRRTIMTPLVRYVVPSFGDLATASNEAVGGADRILAIRRALHEHALLHGLLQLHVNGATLDQVASDISAIAHIDMELARDEAEMLARNPGYGLIALGRMQLFALHERLLRTRGSEYAHADLANEVLELGLPIPLAAEALLGDELEPLLVVGRRTPGVPEPPVISN